MAEKRCYLCKGEADTKDHVPPKGLFPEPRPSNLITVDCCYRCNQKFTKIDEEFRLFVSAPINRFAGRSEDMGTESSSIDIAKPENCESNSQNHPSTNISCYRKWSDSRCPN